MTDLLPWITGSAGALVLAVIAVWALATGKVHSDREFSKLEAENAALRAERDQWRTALETERKTVNEQAAAGQVTNQLIGALTAVATGKALPAPPARPPGLTAEDLGL